MAMRENIWRWGIPIGLTVVAGYIFVLDNPPLTCVPMPIPPLSMASWALAVLVLSPTILLYRGAIWVGERIWPKRYRVGAALLVGTTAILPPLIYSLTLDLASGRQSGFASPPPTNFRTVLLSEVGGRWSPTEGIAYCGSECSKLLFAPRVDRVILTDGHGAAVGLRVERRSLCPPLAAENQPEVLADRGGIAIRVRSDSNGRGPEPDLAARVRALVASGQCLVLEPARRGDADLALGVERRDGLTDAQYAFVDQHIGGGWKRLGERPMHRFARRWVMPFAIAFWPRSPIASRGTYWFRRDASDDWTWAGLQLPMPPWIGWERMRADLLAGVTAPVDQPRDARHQLARDYLERLRRLPADDVDRGLLPLLIKDQRIAPGDLRTLPQLAGSIGTGAMGNLLIARIEQTDPAHTKAISDLADLVPRLPRADWPMLLPSVRRLLRDPQRRGSAGSVFAVMEKGDARDAAVLLALFRKNLPRQSGDDLIRPEAGDAFWRERQREFDLAVALRGLCALAIADNRIKATFLDDVSDDLRRALTRMPAYAQCRDWLYPVATRANEEVGRRHLHQ